MVNKGDYFYVNEYGVKLWVNFIDYFDIGLFLDYCLMCKMVGEMVKGKIFFNLFVYIGLVMVYVVL